MTVRDRQEGSWRYDRPNWMHEFVSAAGARIGVAYKDGANWGWAVYGPERPGVSTEYGRAASKRAAMDCVENAVERFKEVDPTHAR